VSVIKGALVLNLFCDNVSLTISKREQTAFETEK